MSHVINTLVFQTAISIVSYLGMINVNVSTQKKGAKALNPNE